MKRRIIKTAMTTGKSVKRATGIQDGI